MAYTDSFTGSNGTQLTAYSSNWTIAGGGGDPDIQSNGVAPDTADTDVMVYWNADTPGNNQYCQMKFVQLGSTGDYNVGPAVRVATSSITGYFIYSSKFADTEIQLHRAISGSFQQIGLVHTSDLVTGDILRVEAQGNQISVKLNGNVIIGPITDDNIASGRVGIAAYGDLDTRIFDDWEGGELGASASASLSPSASESLSPSLSLSPSASASPSASESRSPSLSPSPSVSESRSPSLSPSPSASESRSPSLSASASASFSTTLSPSASISLSPSPSAPITAPLAFGEQNPNQGEDPVSWQTWSDGEGGTPTVTGNADWGKISLGENDYEARSDVYNLGSSHSRRFILTLDRYEIGSGSATLQIRGDTSFFSQDSNEVEWLDYSGPTTQTWQYVQVRVCQPLPGLLSVSGVNARYFTDGTGQAVFLTGSHTWANHQRNGQGELSFDSYLNSLQSWGHNFFKFWVWESPNPNGWPNCVATWRVTPEIWVRTGPGNANDGLLKFDLTQFNDTFFDDVRARCISAGLHGMYVMVMLFQGWSVAQKGGERNPWPDHPFDAANNINSIDGDPNDDANGYEYQNHSIQAIIDLQDAYIERLIDTVNDLDNIMYETCNEPDGSVTGTYDWCNHVIDKVQAYESTKPKQHPILFSVPYPGGDNDELFASNAEAISPNSGVTNDGSKVVISDTDHEGGIAGDADWAWSKFTSGNGGVLYMDSWDNLWEDCTSYGHPIQNFRDNLGYILALANLTDLIHMVPAGALSSTGYCLGPMSSSYHEHICYQPNNGDFTLDLSAESGTFYIRKVNLADGSIDTAQSTTGGASRTITQPTGWTSGWGCWVHP